MDSPKGRLDQIITKLRARDCRITPQRVAILKIFLSSEEHPSVEQVYAQVKANFPTTSLATVYKTVHLLKEIGEILEIGFADGSNRYDGNKPYPHPHLICTPARQSSILKFHSCPSCPPKSRQQPVTGSFRISSTSSASARLARENNKKI